MVAADLAILGTIASKLHPECVRQMLMILSAARASPPGELITYASPFPREHPRSTSSNICAAESSIITG